MEQTFQRTDLAKEQLDIALDLFLTSKSFVATLTLAGAAEEILGKALRQEGKKTALEQQHSTISSFRTFLERNNFTLKDYINEKNRARNAAKHMDLASHATITVDMQDEALWMLVRALDHYLRLGFNESDRIKKFNNWFYENIVGY